MNFRLLFGISEINREKWSEFVSAHPHGTIFQSPEMFDLYASVNSYKPLVYALEDENGAYRILLLAVIIDDFKGWMGQFSSRTLIYGGPIIDLNTEHPELLTEIVLDALIKEVRKKSLYIQIRNLTDLSLFEPVFRSKSFVKHDHLNLIVRTANTEETINCISKSKIRQARQSLMNGAEVVQATTVEEIHEFYLILEKMYRTRIHKPLPPESFFQTFLEASNKGKLGVILLAKLKGHVIGGIVCPVSPGKTLFEWYICGEDKAYQKIHPSVLLTYSAIEYAAKNGFQKFDFMGIGNPDIPYGVREFKSKFGGRTVNYGRFLLVNNKPIYLLASLGYIVLTFFKIITFQRDRKKQG
ncbi:MAG: GNAT family N-acetyltransferase [Bacteroidetes bacterium]|nr:GNAT family N-acetyltransferase [Bacteroidota bacterium]